MIPSKEENQTQMLLAAFVYVLYLIGILMQTEKEPDTDNCVDKV